MQCGILGHHLTESVVRASSPISSPPVPTVAAGAAREAARWTAALEPDLGYPGPETSFLVLRTVIHVLGTVLPPEPHAVLSGALPTLLRGALHAPSACAAQCACRPLDRIERDLRHVVRSQEAVRAVCALLERRLAPDAWATVRDALPDELGDLLDVPPFPLTLCSRPTRPAPRPDGG